MPYLNLDLDYHDHPKTKRLVGLLGRGAEALPIRLWCYCGKYHADDGKLTGYSAQEIESICTWWGRKGEMIDAFIKVGFLTRMEDGFQVHEWSDHQGHLGVFKERASTAAKARWEKYRQEQERLKNATSIAQAKRKQSSLPDHNQAKPDQVETPPLTPQGGECVEPDLSPPPEFERPKTSGGTLEQETAWAEFKTCYPTRNGKFLGEQEAFRRFCYVARDDWPTLIQAAKNYAASQAVKNSKDGQGIYKPENFIGHPGIGTRPWFEWTEPETQHQPQGASDGSSSRPKHTGLADKDYVSGSF